MFRQIEYKVVEMGAKEEIVNEQAVLVPFLKQISPVVELYFNAIGVSKVAIEEGEEKQLRGITIDWLDNILVEFTSKFDKEGKKIFTADILKIDDTYYVVSFIDGSYYASHYKEEISLPLNEELARKSENVGNVFENGDLISSNEEAENKLENHEQ